jgi:hypothetical protein
MANGDLERPDFGAATDEEVVEYLRASWRWADFEGIGAAEQELERRGRNDAVQRHPGFGLR